MKSDSQIGFAGVEITTGQNLLKADFVNIKAGTPGDVSTLTGDPTSYGGLSKDEMVLK